MYNWIIWAAGGIGAGAVIVGLIIKCHKAIDYIQMIDKHLNDNYLSILRLTIVSDEMPVSERIAAGDKYIALGGNGAVKHLYQQLVEENGKEATK